MINQHDANVTMADNTIIKSHPAWTGGYQKSPITIGLMACWAGE
jgi:hypothetical protein